MQKYKGLVKKREAESHMFIVCSCNLVSYKIYKISFWYKELKNTHLSMKKSALQYIKYAYDQFRTKRACQPRNKKVVLSFLVVPAVKVI